MSPTRQFTPPLQPRPTPHSLASISPEPCIESVPFEALTSPLTNTPTAAAATVAVGSGTSGSGLVRPVLVAPQLDLSAAPVAQFAPVIGVTLSARDAGQSARSRDSNASRQSGGRHSPSPRTTHAGTVSVEGFLSHVDSRCDLCVAVADGSHTTASAAVRDSVVVEDCTFLFCLYCSRCYYL